MDLWQSYEYPASVRQSHEMRNQNASDIVEMWDSIAGSRVLLPPAIMRKNFAFQGRERSAVLTFGD